MKLTCDSLDLSDALTKVGKALPLKKIMPILNGIKVRAEGSTLTLTATDLELAIEKKIKADIKIEGETVIIGKYFTEYMKKIEGEEIILDTNEENRLKITYGESYGYVNTMEADEYPSFKNVSDENTFFIIRKELKDLINKTIFCAATDDSRPTLKGCLFEITKNKITSVATDGFRMASSSKVIEYNGEDLKIIVPARSLSEISKLIDEEEDNIKISVEKNYFMVDLNDTKIVSRLIEGEYINYKRIIPETFMTTVYVEKKAFDTAIDRASLAVRSEKQSSINLEIREEKMTITGESDISGINENVNIELLGKDLVIGFNARYLIECLRAIEDKFIKMGMNTSKDIIIIQPTENTDDYLYMVLPVMKFV